jgi:hypothetical protein
MPPSLVDDAPQTLKQFRSAVNLVQDYQVALVIRQVAGGVGEFGALILVLKVQVDGGLLRADLQSECGFPYLPWPEKNYGGRVAKLLNQSRAEVSDKHLNAIIKDHVCNSGGKLRIFINYC